MMVNPLINTVFILNDRNYLLIAESNACMQEAFTHNLLLEAFFVDYTSHAYC